MKKFKIITDSGCDLCAEMIDKLNVGYIGLVCELEGKNIFEDCGRTLSYKDFYDRISAGSMPRTSQINPNRFYDEFDKYLSEGYDILYIAFSSQLSGTYNSALIAREELLEKYPYAEISVTDSLSGSGGHGLLVYKAAQLKDEGRSIKEISEALEIYKNQLYGYFIVKDLKHLQRGGRISSMSAAVGGMLNITPVLRVSESGTLETIGKVRGDKKALKELVKKIDENIGNRKMTELFITHADNDKAVEILVELIKEKYELENIFVNYMGLAVGSHTGQGAAGVFFLGQER